VNDEDASLWQAYVEVVARVEGALKALDLREEFEPELHFLYHVYRKNRKKG
jgi:hypothetical protein